MILFTSTKRGGHVSPIKWLNGLTALVVLAVSVCDSSYCQEKGGEATLSWSMVASVPALDKCTALSDARITFLDKWSRVAVSREHERKLVICDIETMTGRLEEYVRIPLSHDGTPSDATGIGDGSVAVLDNRYGRCLSYRLGREDNQVEERFAFRGRSKAELLQPKRSIANHTASVIYVTAEASNELWVLSVEKRGVLTAVQCLRSGKGNGNQDANDEVTIVPTMRFPQGLVLSPEGTDLYVAAFSSSALIHFRVEPHDGRLTLARVYDKRTIDTPPIIAQRCTTMPLAVEVTADGKSLYIGGTANSICVFRRNVDNGELSFVQLLTNEDVGLGALKYVKSIRSNTDGTMLAVSCAQTGSVFLFDRLGDGKLRSRSVLTDSPRAKAPMLTGVKDAVFLPNTDFLVVTSDKCIVGVLKLEGVTRNPKASPK